MFPEVTLTTPTREDIQRMADWLNDPDVSTVWYGVGDDGKPLHTGYTPEAVLAGGSDDWDQVFSDENRVIFSVYTGDGEGSIANTSLMRAARSPDETT